MKTADNQRIEVAIWLGCILTAFLSAIFIGNASLIVFLDILLFSAVAILPLYLSLRINTLQWWLTVWFYPALLLPALTVLLPDEYSVYAISMIVIMLWLECLVWQILCSWHKHLYKVLLGLLIFLPIIMVPFSDISFLRHFSPWHECRSLLKGAVSIPYAFIISRSLLLCVSAIMLSRMKRKAPV